MQYYEILIRIENENDFRSLTTVYQLGQYNISFDIFSSTFLQTNISKVPIHKNKTYSYLLSG